MAGRQTNSGISKTPSQRGIKGPFGNRSTHDTWKTSTNANASATSANGKIVSVGGSVYSAAVPSSVSEVNITSQSFGRRATINRAITANPNIVNESSVSQYSAGEFDGSPNSANAVCVSGERISARAYAPGIPRTNNPTYSTTPASQPTRAIVSVRPARIVCASCAPIFPAPRTVGATGKAEAV